MKFFIKEAFYLTQKHSRPRTKNNNSSERLSFIPLGGLGEIGKNMYVLEYEDEILVIDSGLKFPDSELPGIDYIVPDISYLEANKDKILAIIITHGHEDHTGALPYVLPRLDVPIYGTQLTLGLIRNKLQDDLPGYKPVMYEIKEGDVIKIGSFTVRFIAVAHSIPDGVALSIDTPLGRIVHTGDFKLDSTPVDGRVTDYGAFAEEGDKGVMLLCSDSTNAERKGFTPSEKIIAGTLDQLFRTYKSKRIIISSFASNVHRIQQVADVAMRFNRKMAFLGRSMIRNVDLARDTGYLKIDSKAIISIDDIWKYSDNQLVVITTGSQGEPFSGLVTMSRGENKAITLGDHDVVILLASVIPGNEKLVNNTINRLFAQGCEVVYEKDKQTHVSGHASAEELKIIMNIVRPQYFVPIHGEYKHLVRHSQLAQEVGISQRNIFLMVNGDVLTFTKNQPPKKHGHVQSGAVIVDGNAAGSIKSEVLKERREIAEDGVLVVAAAIDERGNLLAPVAIETQGVFISEDTKGVFNELYAASEHAIQELAGKRANVEAVKKVVKTRVRDVLRKRNSSFAVVLPVISVKHSAYYDESNIFEKDFF
ncbi:MAG: ribonuclease J [Synergistaceae bacterium]|nr:ribonuclease J [Synergistaceae bacterium]